MANLRRLEQMLEIAREKRAAVYHIHNWDGDLKTAIPVLSQTTVGDLIQHIQSVFESEHAATQFSLTTQ